MPEGPEVRRAAVRLHAALAGKPITAVGARTKAAKAWLKAHESEIVGRRVARVRSHGKHLLGEIEGPAGGPSYFFHSHFLMWGRWLVVDPADPAVRTRDRRERARFVVEDAAALLYSAPKFDLGPGDPYDALPHLAGLGPDVLPYDGSFDADAFFRRLDAEPDRTSGAALLDQTVAAGIGNYLRARTLQTFAHGLVRLVEPEVVIEVAFDRVQVSKRHESGYALRFPRIVRLREDKPVAEIATLDAVRNLADD